ncbi:MAG: hypothetical protein ABF893_02080, partial [Gluconacetobacter liquefaciens]
GMRRDEGHAGSSEQEAGREASEPALPVVNGRREHRFRLASSDRTSRGGMFLIANASHLDDAWAAKTRTCRSGIFLDYFIF